MVEGCDKCEFITEAICATRRHLFPLRGRYNIPLPLLFYVDYKHYKTLYTSVVLARVYTLYLRNFWIMTLFAEVLRRSERTTSTVFADKSQPNTGGNSSQRAWLYSEIFRYQVSVRTVECQVSPHLNIPLIFNVNAFQHLYCEAAGILPKPM